MWLNLSAEQLDRITVLLLAGPTESDHMLAKEIEEKRGFATDTSKAPYVEAAIDRYSSMSSDGDVDWDDEPFVSASDDGAYVMGWLWVSAEEVEFDEEDTYDDQ